GGRPLLEHALAHAAAAPVDRVVVVLGAGADEVLARVDLHGAEPVVCRDWEEGMAAPLRAGIATLAGCAAVVVLLGDQPLVPAAAVDRVLAARRPDRDAVRATYEGQPGHPVVLERRLFPAIAGLEGDTGARALLAGRSVVEVACEGIADPLDVDSPDDLRIAEQALAS
ncbi:MAG TPA: nucleotidyltransferase family protein, partial [Solirubrobacterales bacterium]|nr:nucleotidyltransferase family protein [Solirubrobacterales bacterium]